MSVFTVHEPPPRAADALADPQRFVFVRDGFYFWAFLLTPIWMIRHRLWLVLVLYLVASIGIDVVLRVFAASVTVIGLAGVLVSLLVGLEAGTLRRFTLARRGWREVGTVSGDRAESAELRFFDTWLRQLPGQNSAPAVKTTVPPPPMHEPPSVTGLFPEPGAPR